MKIPMQVHNQQVPLEQSSVASRQQSEASGVEAQAHGLKKSREKVAGNVGSDESQSTDKTSKYTCFQEVFTPKVLV